MTDVTKVSGGVSGSPWPGLIHAYREHLALPAECRPITLLEGNTPLVDAERLARWVCPDRPPRLMLKLEGANPTGSFKDRGMTMAVTLAVHHGSQAVICASTGNTSASAAAYAARAGIRSAVLLPHGSVAMGKLSQAVMHGARIVPIRGSFDDALRLVRQVSETHPISLVNSVNPVRIEGQKTGAFEICDALGAAPDLHCLPVGNAGNITAYWKGYQEYRYLGKIATCPKLLGFQAEGASPIVRGEVVSHPQTVATAIRIGNPASWSGAVLARDESGGRIDSVTDEEILTAYHRLAELEGVFCEPASAASVAGIRRLTQIGALGDLAGKTVVCILTGHGLKDPTTAVGGIPELVPVEPTLDAVASAIFS